MTPPDTLPSTLMIVAGYLVFVGSFVWYLWREVPPEWEGPPAATRS